MIVIDNRLFYDIHEVMDLLQVTRQTVYYKIKKGNFRSVVLSGKNHVSKEDVDNYLGIVTRIENDKYVVVYSDELPCFYFDK